MKFIGGLFALGVYGFFAGVIFIAAIFWWHSHDLPKTEQLAEYQPATLSRLHASDGRMMAEFVRERRLYTPIDEIPELVKNAFISAEDKNFYLHKGVDGLGLVKAMIDNFLRFTSGRRLRGASTITQQVVKNFLLSGEKAVSRKIKEAILAQRLEQALTKEQILELYLNEIFLGSRSYGVTSAAQRYFGKRLEDLTPAEAAYLAALPKAPSTLHPIRAKERATERRDYVLREMLENGHIDQATYETEVASELDTVLDDQPEEEEEASIFRLDYFGEEIRRQLIEKYGDDGVYGGGMSIRATVDPRLQNMGRRILQKHLWDFSREHGYGGPAARIPNFDPEGDWRVALAETDVPRDLGDWRPAVVLLVGERSAEIGVQGYESSEPIYLPFSDVREWAAPRQGFDSRDRLIVGDAPQSPSDVWSVGDVIYVENIGGEGDAANWSMRQIPDVNGALVAMDPNTGRVLAMQGGFSFEASEFNRATQAQRQPGSSFKPFVYAAALEHGYKPNTIVLDAPVTLEQLQGDPWKPQNYSGRFYGPSPMRVGLEKSQNLMTVRIALDVTLDEIAKYAERFGVYDDMPRLISYALGSGETTLLRMTASYAMFVNGGKRIEPTLIDRIQDRHGRTVFRHDQRICTGCQNTEWRNQPEPYIPDEGEQVMDPVTAYQIVWMLNGVTTRGTAAKIGAALDFDIAGKTGTTNDARDAWFIGFSPDLVVGCFVGYDNPRSLGNRASGGSICGPVFQEFMDEAMEGRPKHRFRRPSDVEMVRVDRNNGCAVAAGAVGDQYIWEAFRASTEPMPGDCPPGGIAAKQEDDSFDAAIERVLAEPGQESDGLGLGAGAASQPNLRLNTGDLY